MHIILKCIAPNLMEFDAPLVLISMHHASNMEPDRTLSWPYHYLQLLDLLSSALRTLEFYHVANLAGEFPPESTGRNSYML